MGPIREEALVAEVARMEVLEDRLAAALAEADAACQICGMLRPGGTRTF